jgi:hypothetical protein
MKRKHEAMWEAFVGSPPLSKRYVVRKAPPMQDLGRESHVALDDDAVETMVYKNQQAAEQVAEDFHRSAPGGGVTTKSWSADRWKSIVVRHERLP